MRRLALGVVVLFGCGSGHPTAPPGPPIVIGNAPSDAGVGAAPRPAAFALQCQADAEQPEFNPYDRPGTIGADDGSHRDTCDAQGNLISYQCEFEGIRCANGGDRRDRHKARPCYRQTGKAAEDHIDCDGRCVDGACAQRCPTFGDELVYVTVGRTVVFDSGADARDITCTLSFDQKDDFDCASDPRPGDKLVIEGLGMSSSTCTGGVWGALSDHHCTYSDCSYSR